jgi:hypothetical protein
MARFCPNCGTEVDDSAVFCPTCGQPIDQEVEAQMPAAPAWPDPEPAAPVPEPTRDPTPEPAYEPEHATSERVWEAPAADEPTRVEDRPRAAEPVAQPPPPPRTEAGAPAARPTAPAGPTLELPLTMPVTLSAWLIGGGAAVGALGALIALFDGFGSAIALLVLVGLLGVAASVFGSTKLPAISNLRLATLAIVLVAFGIGLDRLGVGGAGVGELLLFLGTAAAAIGVLMVELGHDQPLGGPST